MANTTSTTNKGANRKILRLVTLDREETISSIPFTANAPATLPTQGGIIPSNRFLYGLKLHFRGRVTNAASGNPTAVLADAPWSIINLVDIQGYHRPRAKTEDFFNLRGPDIYQLNKNYSSSNPFVNYVVNGSSAAALSTAASATNDFEFILSIIFPPEKVGLMQQFGYLLDAPNYDSLVMNVYFADDKSLFSGQTTASTFSAFGSATGSPEVRVSGIFAQGGSQAFQGFIPGRVWRYYKENVSGDIVSGATQSRQYNIPTGYQIRSILMKTGIKATTVSSGNNAYSSLTDSIFQNITVYRGTNNAVRLFRDYQTIKEASRQAYAILPDTGYALIDFCKHGALFEMFDATQLTAGPTGNVDFYLASDVAGAAGQASLFVCQEVRGKPQGLAA
ncbi:MAG TPA: hypothetical protein VGY31_03445 [Terriglobia bacterium]|nr:hypothetical protein [Terriglobia bacterium]